MKTGSPYARLGIEAEVPTLAWEQQLKSLRSLGNSS